MIATRMQSDIRTFIGFLIENLFAKEISKGRKGKSIQRDLHDFIQDKTITEYAKEMKKLHFFIMGGAGQTT